LKVVLTLVLDYKLTLGLSMSVGNLVQDLMVRPLVLRDVSKEQVG
jgi:hypothetical protein